MGVCINSRYEYGIPYNIEVAGRTYIFQADEFGQRIYVVNARDEKQAKEYLNRDIEYSHEYELVGGLYNGRSVFISGLSDVSIREITDK